jgi:hypothetical protein
MKRGLFYPPYSWLFACQRRTETFALSFSSINLSGKSSGKGAVSAKADPGDYASVAVFLLGQIRAELLKHGLEVEGLQKTTMTTRGKPPTKKSVARSIHSFLGTEYDLSGSVVIANFIKDVATDDDAEEEMSKAKSQLAIATQRAAALFALQANLLATSLEELCRYIEATKQNEPDMYKQIPGFFDTMFVKPLEEEAEVLQAKVSGGPCLRIMRKAESKKGDKCKHMLNGVAPHEHKRTHRHAHSQQRHIKNESPLV